MVANVIKTLRLPVIASEAWQSIALLDLGDGLPRFARSDEGVRA